jgi:hypothetical protein
VRGAYEFELCPLVGNAEDRPVEAIVIGEGPEQGESDDLRVERTDSIQVRRRPSDAHRG